MFVCTIQPVVKLAVSCIQTFNRLSNGSNPFDNRLDICLHDTTSCQTGCTTQFDNWLYPVNKHPTGCQTGCIMSTGHHKASVTHTVDHRLDVTSPHSARASTVAKVTEYTVSHCCLPNVARNHQYPQCTSHHGGRTEHQLTACSDQ